jgi:tetratricopeptide (TPR) repeat protein
MRQAAVLDPRAGRPAVAPEKGGSAVDALALNSPAVALAELVQVLALRRLRRRLVGAAAAGGPDRDVAAGRRFLDDRRPSVIEALRLGTRRACLALEVALRGEALWERVAAELPREPRDLLQAQARGLRGAVTRAGLAGEDPQEADRTARALQEARRTGGMGSEGGAEPGELFARAASPDLAACAPDGDVEPRAASVLVERLRQAGREELAHLLGLCSRYGELFLVGLVDAFVCRALQADPRAGADFVFVHVERPEDLWDGDLGALARIVEQQTSRVEALLDHELTAEAQAAATGTDAAAVERLFHQGLDCYLAADYQRAIAFFTAALRLNPDGAPLYAYRGDAYRLLCEYDLAIADYSQALDLNPATAPVLVQRAIAHRLKGDPPRCVADCDAAVALDPRQATAYSTRGEARLELGQLDEAVADFDTAVGLQPHNPTAYHGRGQAHLRRGALEEAVADFGRVLELNPHHVLARLYRGDACRRKGDLAQAILDYGEVLRLHPRNAIAHASRGQAYEQAGDFDRAVSDYSKALALDPKSGAVHCRRGAVLRRKGDLDRALTDLDSAIRLGSDDGIALYNRGMIFLARGLPDEARADFGDALDLNPALAGAHLGRALACDRLGRYPEGIQDCGRALKLQPMSPAAHLIRAVLASHAGLYPQAIQDLTSALKLDPTFPPAYHERGMAYLLHGDHDRAAADFTRLLELDPNVALAYAARGVVRQIQGQHAQAVADFDRALQLDPQSILAGYHQYLAEGARSRTTQLLADYIEGIRPRIAPPVPVVSLVPDVPVKDDGAGPEAPTSPRRPAPPGRKRATAGETARRESATAARATPADAAAAAETSDYIPAPRTGKGTAKSAGRPRNALAAAETSDYIPAPRTGKGAVAKKAALPNGSTSPPRRPSKPLPEDAAAAETIDDIEVIEDAPAPEAADDPGMEDSVEIFLVDEEEPAPKAADGAQTKKGFGIEDSAAILLLDEGGKDEVATARHVIAPAQVPSAAAPKSLSPPAAALPGPCPTCRAVALPAERLPDGRVRCGKCNALFLPAPVAPPVAPAPRQPMLPPAPAAGPAPAKKSRKRPAVDDDDEPRLTTMQKVILGVGAAAAVFFVVYFSAGVFDYFRGSAFAGPTGVRVSAENLLREFAKNPKTVSKKYQHLDEPLCISGTVAEVLDKKIRFQESEGSMGLEVSFTTEGDMRGVQKDQKVTVEGKCMGIQKDGNVLVALAKVFPYAEPPAAQEAAKSAPPAALKKGAKK